MKPAPIILLLLVVGCANYEKRSYDVSLTNQSGKPVTIWLTKNGPAYEQGWKSPEDLAIESPRVSERIGGVVVEPGKTASTGPMIGRFGYGVDAILRVYQGQRTFAELLAMSRGHADRVDFPLGPGTSELVVTDEGLGIKVSRAKP